MFRKEMRQLCNVCKGTGINSRKPLTTRDGKPLLAPIYEKGEANRQQFDNCQNCGGSGWSMQASPRNIFQDGEKVQLSDEELKERYTVNL